MSEEKEFEDLSKKAQKGLDKFSSMDSQDMILYGRSYEKFKGRNSR